MWSLLDTYTVSIDSRERSVNHNNEWGGFSRKLNLPVFTGWLDHTVYDKVNKTTTALISDEAWVNRPIGLKNQERWIKFAEDNHEGVAAFFIIHAVDVNAEIRKVEYIDGDKVFVGKISRENGKVFIIGQPQKLA